MIFPKLFSEVRFLAAFLLLMSITATLSAKHIVGGDVTYKCLGIENSNVRFEITFTMYRDTKGGGANFDANANFGIYRGSGNNWVFYDSKRESPREIEDINLDTGNPCLKVPSGIGVEKGVYRFEVVLEISDTDSYMIAYQRCCRNNTIFNILEPGDTGALYSVVITPPAQSSCDNSPIFNDFPPVVICANALLEFDHSASDADGDQVVYSFCTPKAAGGTDGVGFGNAEACTGITPDPINCLPPYDDVIFNAPTYTFDRPIGGNPVVNINNNSGLISGVPNVIGQFVVGVCAQTFRDGVLMGEVRRDFQFNVTTCEVAVRASMEADKILDNNRFLIEQCGDLNINIANLSTDLDKILTYDWEFYIGNDTIREDMRNFNYVFPDTGTYEGVMYLNKLENFDDCKDTGYVTLNLYPEIIADFELIYDTCDTGPVELNDLSESGAGPILSWDWRIESEEVSNSRDLTYQYEEPGMKTIEIAVEDQNGCRDSIQKTMPWYPVSDIIIVEPSRFTGCLPAQVRFNNLTEPINEEYIVEWDFGDGTTTQALSPLHSFEEIGVYSVGLSITSPLGCYGEANFENWIRVLDSPKAGFTYTPEEPSVFNKTVEFTDNSEDAINWLYIIGDLGVLERNPTYTFVDTGAVDVFQIVTHENGCTDTAYALIDILPIATLFMPNAFTPNNDGLNDDFIGAGFKDGLRNYTMQVWNRWGDQIFETNDPNQGWNGQVNNSGRNCPGGVYVYTVSYIGPRGENKNLKGHVTLIR